MADILHLRAPAPDRTVSYSDHPHQVYDVRLPRGAALNRTVVIVHGGFWRPEYDRSHAGRQAAAFAELGFHVAVLEYRRTGWDDVAADVRAGAAAIAANPDLPDSPVFVGHSAGGQLVAWLLHQPEGRAAAGAVSLAGCLDLLLVDQLGLGNHAVQALLGTTPAADEKRWAAADPAQLGQPPKPLSVLHGTQDDEVPLQVAESFAAKVSGIPLEILDGAGHYEFIDPKSPHFDRVAQAARLIAERI